MTAIENSPHMSPLSQAIWLLASYGMERETRERQQQTAEVSLVCETGDTSAAVTPNEDARRDGHDTTV